MSFNDQFLEEIKLWFSEYLSTDDCKRHLETMKKEKQEVKELIEKLLSMDRKDLEFTDLVLYGLVPHSNTKRAKRVSLFPATMNIKWFLKKYNYTDEDWNVMANKIFDLCYGFYKTPEKLGTLIESFSGDEKYSRSFQTGTITPILYWLNDSFPIVNNRVRRTYKSVLRQLWTKDKLYSMLSAYLEDIEKLKQFSTILWIEEIKNNDYLDLFCYRYDEFVLPEKKSQKDTEAESEINQEIWEEIELQKFDIINFVKEINLESLHISSAHSLWDPERIKINAIISACDKAKWVLPKFQRYFDWTKERITGLIESIFKDYYVGSFLLWEKDEAELGIQPIFWVTKEDIRQTHIILDGQQRMTSLYYVIKAPGVPLKRMDKPIYFYINFYNFFMNGVERDIVEYHSMKFPLEETYTKLLFPMYELENFDKWLKWLSKFIMEQLSWDADGIVKRTEIRDIMNDKLGHIREWFEIPYITLPESMELYQVSDIFEQINTKGKPLNIFDLLIARLYKYDLELKELWDSVREQYPNINRYYIKWKMDKIPIYILQSMALAYDSSNSVKKQDILDIYKKIYQDSERDFEADREEMAEYMEMAIKRLENLKGWYWVKDEWEIPFEPMIPVLAALLRAVEWRNDKADCYRKIDTWYWSSVFTNAYSSSTDSQKTLDYKEATKWFDDDTFKPWFVTAIERSIDSLHLEEVKQTGNAKYRGVLSILALQWCMDFDTGQSLETARNNDKDHIFPVKWKFIITHWFETYKNSVLNMTWLSSTTNRSRQHKNPSIYVPNFIKEKYHWDENLFKELLETHLINHKAYNALIHDDFEKFINIRNENIVNRIRELVWIGRTSFSESIILPGKSLSNEMIFIHMLKNCNEYIYWIDKYFSEVWFEFLIRAMKNSDVKEIKIIVAIDHVNEGLKKVFKKFKEELQPLGVISEVRVIMDTKEKRSIHDRFIVSKYEAYNIPSTDIVKMWQLSEITKSENKEQLYQIFNEVWNNAKDLLKDWSIIEQKLWQ